MKAETITISDPQTGSEAEILVSLGFNCFRFTAMPQGRPVEVLYAPEGFTTGQARPSKGGVPLMLPFPGRIPGTTFTWEGKPYELEAGDGLGNAIHGFVMWRRWRIMEQTDSHAVGEFHAWRDDPSLKTRWPADFRITAEYRLVGNALKAEYSIENPGDVPLPCGFGTHPYFRVPIGGPSADECVVSLPVSAKWELEKMLPTGRRLPLAEAAAFQAGRRYGDLQLDHAFSGLSFAGGWCQASIRDSDSGLTVTQRFDEAFRECVVYTPPHREAICIEPLTCVPGCFELTQRGIDAGLKIVPPGESFSARVEIAVLP
jgi:aldose 1-epimerase